MKLENQELIEEYFEKVKHQYPGVTFDQFKLSCTTPFLKLRKEMESGELKTVRLMYFGTFVVYPKRVAGMLETLKEQFRDLKVDAKLYFYKKEIYEKFLSKHE